MASAADRQLRPMEALIRLGGGLFFVVLMAVGYFYNLTFIQLGLVDLGTRAVGLSEATVAVVMAAFALITAGIAVATGWWLRRRGWSAEFRRKLRLAFVVILIQTGLTAAVLFVTTAPAFVGWVVACSFVLGVGVPATFGLTVDLVPVRYRGLAAGLITGAAFAPAAAFASTWEIDAFARLMLPLMTAGIVPLGVLAFGRHPLIDRLADQHRRPEYREGRFVRSGTVEVIGRRFALALAAMFAIYFIDSLGFLRIVATPTLVITTWQSADPADRIAIAGFHLIGAAAGGVLYRAISLRAMFLWIFGLFAISHLSYAFHSRIVPESYSSLGAPLVYAVAVSLYTVLNFAVWADFSTPTTISWWTALGVGVAGWTATFLSTALAVAWRSGGPIGAEYFNLVAAITFLAALAVVAFSRPTRCVPDERS